jgi:hypothetical protein
MRPVSSAWGRTVTGSFTPVYRATALAEFQTGTSPTGVAVDIMGGTVELDGLADVYASLEMTVPGELWPSELDLDATIAPYGVEAYVQAGIRYRDDLIELVGLGYFRVRTLSQEEATTGGPIELTGQDRMSTLARAKLLAPLKFPASDTNGEFATALVSEVFPDAEIEWDDDVESQALGRDVIVEDDRVAALRSMAVSAGKVMRFDHRGVLVFFTPPNPLDSAPVASLVAGRGGVLSAVSRELTDEGVVNAIVARGDGSDDVGAAYAVAYDVNPHSPTRYRTDGRGFGPSPDYLTSSLITTNDLAVIAASAELQRRGGLPHTLDFEVSPRFELEPDDLIHIEHRNGIGRHLIASLSIPLLAGQTMTGVTRQRLLVPVGTVTS